MLRLSEVPQFVRYVLPAVLRPLRVLWNQVIGFFFLVMAVVALWRTVRFVQDFKGGADDVFRLLLSAVFIVIMGGYGVYSFLRARRVPKS